MKKYFLFLIMVLFASMFLVSCDSSGTAVDPETPVESINDLCGTWKTGTDSDYITIKITNNVTAMFEVNEKKNTAVTNTYVVRSLEDSILTLAYGEDSYTFKVKLNAEKTELALTQTEGSNIFSQHSGTTTFTFTKQE